MSENEILYHERLTSPTTTGLFIGLAGLSSGLFFWRRRTGDFWMKLFAFFSGFFLFYAVNYRTLEIVISRQALVIHFGIFTWQVPLENIAGIAMDSLPPIQRYGGAGIHGMLVGGRYRASFNFLEYPRLVVALRHKAGPVQDISFSTHQPEAVLHLLREATTA